MNPWRRYAPVWQRRAATTIGAVLIGLVALAFAGAADVAQEGFAWLVARWPLLPLALTPAAYALIAWMTRMLAPEARSSGIPQVIAATHNAESEANERLTSLRTAAVKLVMTVLALGAGGSVGREGPTVQISAAIMNATHRLFRVPLTAAVTIAGGAAGVSAAFNTPLAGVAFAIEELASAYEQRLALLTMAAVLIAGLVSLGIAGDYVYFGAVHESLSLQAALVIAPVAGVAGGLLGGLFSRIVLWFTFSAAAPIRAIRARPVAWAAAAGLLIAVIGIAGAGLTWGTGYDVSRRIIEGGAEPLWFGPAKMLTTLLTALSGIPGGIFAPSLAAGTGLGQIIASLFPGEPVGAVVVLGMIAYFVGVVRAPLTAVLIVSEMTDGHRLILPLFATAIIAEGVSALVSPERLYHGLSRAFRDPA
ncbi:chloride channel protein [Kaistia geumhonensis]|uniref:H+/Cl- antiporter ClcA n=1 Tax=Kaistia geumhonensis TaxID=410839 RepID=A0ABU0MBR3_9HYPH|nr:chloride channel protein [Kaistia geumhonensis]MCX5481344.1 chloride channel protein [Kaistia geumhonensis]MDQ0518405.1 H+/Cl- antiporter ClcA [Kaistia geumhonensis]